MNKRIDDIEILRAFAVIFVIVEHINFNLFAWNTPTLKAFYGNFGGWVGVDLFFVISGYVIAKDLVPRLQASASRQLYFRNTLVFWVRRFWRLVPSAWFWLCLILLASIVFNQSGAWGPFANNLKTAVAAMLQLANFHVAMIFGSEFAGAGFVYWSLSLEEQFYIVLPLVVFISGRWLPYVLAVIVIPQLFMERDTPLLALVRTDALFLGVLIALWAGRSSYRNFQPRFLRHPALALSLTAIMLLVLAYMGAEKTVFSNFRYGIVACLSGLLVLAASYDQDYFARPAWLKKPLLWVGTRSYALYLAHMPSYFLTREIWYRLSPAGTRFNTDYTWHFLVTALVLLIILSELNYRFIETPFRRRGVRIARRMLDRGSDQGMNS
jgi:peptidoglycan/LPS O-acetylase OafA/YrhL